ncbi:leukocyte surface antigen CD53-like [Symsagittifera roscoffensis]|uniref:leukocyte surface antigen CD53-like n=1 Tax=Symsagittifera roscoffensis TaxID=84072 RepID=UPI00307C59E9
MHLLRQLLICTNCLLLTLTAIFVSIVGFLIFSSREELDWIASPSTQNYLVYILVGFILLVVLTAFFGFVGSLKSSKQCMFLYISFLAMAITFELATGAVLFRYYTKGELRNVGEELMFQSMEKYTKDKTVRTLWNGYQSKMECCGVTGFMNWWKYTVKPPMSCCRKHSEFGEICGAQGWYMTGCLDATMGAIDGQVLVLQISYFTLLVTHVVQMMIACCVLKAINHDTEYV